MPWLMVYSTVAVAALSVLAACCAKGVRRDPGSLVAIVAAAALWPVLIVGLLQFAAVHLYARHLRRHAPKPPAAAPAEPEPVTAPTALVDSLVRMAQQVGAKTPA